MIEEAIRIISFLLPIPFMVMFYVKTKKFDRIKNYSILAILFPFLLERLFIDIGYKTELIVAYLVFVIFGASIFYRKGWNYLQSLSVSFCLVYFGSFLWELPYHIYTIIVRGGIDGAFPLHLLFIFPMVFVYEKIRTNMSKKVVFVILFSIIGYSTVVMFSLLSLDANIWNVGLNPIEVQNLEEALWMVTRIITMLSLFVIYSNSELRKRSKEKIVRT